MNPSHDSSPESDDPNEHSRHSFLQHKFGLLIDKNPTLSLDQAFYLEYTKMYIETIQLEKQVPRDST